MLVIEMNPRVSRSSALASKATGFPIAKIAAKLAIGYTLDELKNDITGGATPASFEPTIDYVVTKIPRFTFEKFPGATTRLTTQMKSVGEVMAIGRNFQESLQKALRGLETGIDGLDEKCTAMQRSGDLDDLSQELRQPGPERILYVADAIRAGLSVPEINALTGIDPWFLVQIEDLVAEEQTLRKDGIASLDRARLRRLKRKGFSDARLARVLKKKETLIRQRRIQMGLRPVYKRVDTCAAEFSTTTAYLYSTYEDECEAEPTDRPNTGRRPEPHRPGHRVRLLLRARFFRAQGSRFRDHHGELQSGNGLDGFRYVGPAVLRAADVRRRHGDHREGEAARRDRAVRRADPAQTGTRPGSGGSTDYRHLAGFDRPR
jgi:carbamoyl-phosphate synthase large subunit